MPVRESKYQSYLVVKLKDVFPECVILRNDPQHIQGVPDLLILSNHRWAMLEVKSSPRSRRRPNQAYYVDLFDDMSFGRFINPENEEEIFNELQYLFET